MSVITRLINKNVGVGACRRPAKKEVKYMKKKISLMLVTVLMLLSIMPTALAAGKVPVLLYHNIMDGFKNEDKLLHISPENFKIHMQAILDAGYNPITYEQFTDASVNGSELPRNPIIITFDDGYQSNYEYAYPVLKELGINATIFVITSRMGDYTVTYPHFTWETAIEMENSGIIDIQSHSHTHPDFSTIDEDQTIYEARMAKYLIETNMNKECTNFAYPYGQVNGLSNSVMRRVGYDIVNLVGDKGSNNPQDGLVNLKRLTVPGDYTAEELLQYIARNK